MMGECQLSRGGETRAWMRLLLPGVCVVALALPAGVEAQTRATTLIEQHFDLEAMHSTVESAIANKSQPLRDQLQERYHNWLDIQVWPDSDADHAADDLRLKLRKMADGINQLPDVEDNSSQTVQTPVAPSSSASPSMPDAPVVGSTMNSPAPPNPQVSPVPQSGTRVRAGLLGPLEVLLIPLSSVIAWIYTYRNYRRYFQGFFQSLDSRWDQFKARMGFATSVAAGTAAVTWFAFRLIERASQ